MAKLISINGSISSGMNAGAAVGQALFEVGVEPGLMQRTYENVVRNGGTAVIQGPRGVAQVIAEPKDMPNYAAKVSHVTPTNEEFNESEKVSKPMTFEKMFEVLFLCVGFIGLLVVGFIFLVGIFDIHAIAGIIGCVIYVLCSAAGFSVIKEKIDE